jgi:hypothetical protein
MTTTTHKEAARQMVKSWRKMAKAAKADATLAMLAKANTEYRYGGKGDDVAFLAFRDRCEEMGLSMAVEDSMYLRMLFDVVHDSAR